MSKTLRLCLGYSYDEPYLNLHTIHCTADASSHDCGNWCQSEEGRIVGCVGVCALLANGRNSSHWLLALKGFACFPVHERGPWEVGQDKHPRIKRNH